MYSPLLYCMKQMRSEISATNDLLRKRKNLAARLLKSPNSKAANVFKDFRRISPATQG